jgi:hypothetical protein
VSSAIANRAAPALLAVAMFAAVVNLGADGRAQSPNLSRNGLVATAAAYVKAYQREFAFLVADEHTVQEAFGVKDSTEVALAKRTTRGEIFITFLDRLHHWTTVRDVAEVNGTPVLNRPDLRALLSRDDPDTVARRVFSLNAQYNIGGTKRDFNDPMLALLPLSDAHRSRFAFDVDGTDRLEAGVVLARLSFRERERPTLVRPESGGAVYAKGAITMDAASGTVRRTRFTVEYDKISAELITEFSRDERLGLWLPSTFSERYTVTVDDLKDLTTATSTYTNYRRFEARGRLLPGSRNSDP